MTLAYGTQFARLGVPLGSGYLTGESSELDEFGKSRLDAEFYAFRVKEIDAIGLTGSLKHPHTGAVYWKEAKHYLLMRGMPEERIVTPSNVPGYNYETDGDVAQGIVMAHFVKASTVMWGTEEGHYERVLYFAKKKSLNLRFGHVKSVPNIAQWRYKAHVRKEKILVWALRKSDRFKPFFFLYIVEGLIWRALFARWVLPNYVVRLPWRRWRK